MRSVLQFQRNVADQNARRCVHLFNATTMVYESLHPEPDASGVDLGHVDRGPV